MTRSEVFEILKDYYGEDRVDTSNDSYAIIWWPSVVVSNEAGDKITIWDLYGKVRVEEDGKAINPYDGLRFKRTTYNKVQWYNSYCHSHISWSNGIHDDITKWCTCCLGSGPLVHTFETLQGHPTPEVWELLAWELDKYVRVESENGGPYHHMRDLYANYDDTVRYPIQLSRQHYKSDLINSFFRYTLEHNVLDFSYRNGKYVLGEDINEAVLRLSNQFIDWYNMSPSSTKKKEALSHILETCIYSSGKILFKEDETDRHNRSSYHQPLDSCIGTTMLRFKGQDIKLKSTSMKSTPIKVTVINKNLISWILYTILNYVNEHYGKPKAA